MYSKWDVIDINDDGGGYINDIDIHDDDLLFEARKWFEKYESGYNKCPFCNHPIGFQTKNIPLKIGERDVFNSGYEYLAKLWSCNNCRFWQLYIEHYMLDSIHGDYYWHLVLSKLQEFSDTLPDSCNQEMSQFLRRNPNYWNTMNPHKLEKIVRDIFNANYTNCEVIHVGKPDDGGIDVLLIDTEKEKWLIQVKRRTKAYIAEGVETIRNVLGAMFLNNILKGVVVSTVDHFSYRAEEAAKNAERKGYVINLVDKGILNRMLDPILPYKPWIKYMDTEGVPNKELFLCEDIWIYPGDEESQLSLFDNIVLNKGLNDTKKED